MKEDVKDFMHFVFWMLMAFVVGSRFGVYLQNDHAEKYEIRITGNTLENIEKLKKDCEKDGQECVLIYEFVPSKTSSEK